MKHGSSSPPVSSLPPPPSSSSSSPSSPSPPSSLSSPSSLPSSSHCFSSLRYLASCYGTNQRSSQQFSPNIQVYDKSTKTQSIFEQLYVRESFNASFIPRCTRHGICGKKSLVKGMKLNRLLKGHEGCVNTLNWNQSGTLLLSGSDDTDVRLWSHPSEQEKNVTTIHTGHTGNVFCALFVPFTQDTKVISCAADGDIRYFDITKSSPNISSLHHFRVHNSMVNKLVCDFGSPDLFMSCSSDGTARFFDLRDTQKPSILVDLRSNGQQNRTLEINSISANPIDPNYFIVGGGDVYVRIYDRRKPKHILKQLCPATVLYHSKKKEEKKDNTVSFPIYITSVRYDYLGQGALVSYSGEDVYYIDLNASPLDELNLKTTSIDNHFEINEKASTTKTSSSTTSSSTSFISDVFQKRDEMKIMNYCGHVNIRTVKEVSFMGPKNEYVVSGSDCGHVFIWETQTGILQNILKADLHVVNCLAPCTTFEPILATSGIEYDIKMWDCSIDANMHCKNNITSNTNESSNSATINQDVKSHDYGSVMDKCTEILKQNQHQLNNASSWIQVPASLVFNIMTLLNNGRAANVNTNNNNGNNNGNHNGGEDDGGEDVANFADNSDDDDSNGDNPNDACATS